MEILHWNKIAGSAAFHAARTACSHSRPVAFHGHDFAEVFWIDAGKGLHEINGTKIPIRAGSLAFIRPADRHGFKSTGQEELTITNIAFPVETLRALRRRYFSSDNIAFWHSGELPATRQIDVSTRRRLNGWADELSLAPRTRLHIERFLLNVLAELSLEQSTVPFADMPEWLAHACRAIEKPDQLSGGVARFFQLAGRSREHVARTVRAHLGTSPTGYVNQIRMAQAMRQLEMGNRDILDIALDCGIENLSHFYSLFRKNTGMTPRAYRLSHRQPLRSRG